MKKNLYIQPFVEISNVRIVNGICATSYTQSTGDPISGDPNDGR